jgi:hypothetical protein
MFGPSKREQGTRKMRDWTIAAAYGIIVIALGFMGGEVLGDEFDIDPPTFAYIEITVERITGQDCPDGVTIGPISTGDLIIACPSNAEFGVHVWTAEGEMETIKFY